MRTLLLLGIALLGASDALAATLKNELDIRAFADRVMVRVGAGDLAGAFAEMKPCVIVPAAEFDAVALNSKSMRDQFGVRYGATIGYEFIAQDKLGDSLLRLTYIEKTQVHALPWTFIFYRGPDGWILNTFNWNDKIQDLFGPL